MKSHRQLLSQRIQSARLSLQSSELAPPALPLTRKRVLPPPLVPGGGGTHSLAGEGAGGPNSEEGTDTLLLYSIVESLYG
jgi:hypothetical protein